MRICVPRLQPVSLTRYPLERVVSYDDLDVQIGFAAVAALSAAQGGRSRSAGSAEASSTWVGCETGYRQAAPLEGRVLSARGPRIRRAEQEAPSGSK